MHRGCSTATSRDRSQVSYLHRRRTPSLSPHIALLLSLSLSLSPAPTFPSLDPHLPLRTPLPETMVSAASRKRKRVHIQIRTGIPIHKDAVVTCMEVTRSTKQRILAKSRKVSVPVTETPSSQDPSSPTSEPQPSAADSGPPIGKPRKGPSRSVAVRLSVIFTFYLTNNSLYRLSLRSGYGSIERNLPTN